MSVIKAKIFFGSGYVCDPNAAEKFNEWIKEHPEVNIIDFRYQQTGNSHSIAILYLEDYN